MPQNEFYCNNIKKKLSWLVTEVSLDSGPNCHSINIHAESFFREFLNILFDWHLVNANNDTPNAAGIDLLCTDDNVVVQISSTYTTVKIQSSLEKAACFHGFHFCFVAISSDKHKFTKFNTFSLYFNPSNDIWTPKRLYEKIVEDGNIKKQKALSDLVDLYYPDREKTANSERAVLSEGSDRLSADEVIAIEGAVKPGCRIIIVASKHKLDSGLLVDTIVKNIQKGVIYQYILPTTRGTTTFLETCKIWWNRYLAQLDSYIHSSEQMDYWSNEFLTVVRECRNIADGINNSSAMKRAKRYFLDKVQVFIPRSFPSYATYALYQQQPGSNHNYIIINQNKTGDDYSAYLVPEDDVESVAFDADFWCHEKNKKNILSKSLPIAWRA